MVLSDEAVIWNEDLKFNAVCFSESGLQEQGFKFNLRKRLRVNYLKADDADDEATPNVTSSLCMLSTI